jgi:hypothetical protein
LKKNTDAHSKLENDTMNTNETSIKSPYKPSIGGAVMDEKQRVWEITGAIVGLNKKTDQLYAKGYTLVYKGHEKDVPTERLTELINEGKIKVIR